MVYGCEDCRLPHVLETHRLPRAVPFKTDAGVCALGRAASMCGARVRGRDDEEARTVEREGCPIKR